MWCGVAEGEDAEDLTGAASSLVAVTNSPSRVPRAGRLGKKPRVPATCVIMYCQSMRKADTPTTLRMLKSRFVSIVFARVSLPSAPVVRRFSSLEI